MQSESKPSSASPGEAEGWISDRSLAFGDVGSVSDQQKLGYFRVKEGEGEVRVEGVKKERYDVFQVSFDEAQESVGVGSTVDPVGDPFLGPV